MFKPLCSVEHVYFLRSSLIAETNCQRLVRKSFASPVAKSDHPWCTSQMKHAPNQCCATAFAATPACAVCAALSSAACDSCAASQDSNCALGSTFTTIGMK